MLKSIKIRNTPNLVTILGGSTKSFHMLERVVAVQALGGRELNVCVRWVKSLYIVHDSFKSVEQILYRFSSQLLLPA